MAAGVLPPGPVLSADLDGDGLGDLAVLRPDLAAGVSDVLFHRGRPDGALDAASVTRLTFLATSLHRTESGDVLASGIGPERSLLSFAPDGTLAEAAMTPDAASTQADVPFDPWHAAPAAGDFSGDGLADVASLDEQGRILLRLGTPGGGYGLPHMLGGGVRVSELVAVSSPAGVRLAALERSEVGPRILLFGASGGGLTMQLGPQVPAALVTCLISCDIDGDGLGDLAAASLGGAAFAWMQRADGGFGGTPDLQVDAGGLTSSLAYSGGRLFGASLTGQVSEVGAASPAAGAASAALPIFLASGVDYTVIGEAATGRIRMRSGEQEQAFDVGVVAGVVAGRGWVAALDRESGRVKVFGRGEDGVFQLSQESEAIHGARGLALVEDALGVERLLVSTRSGGVQWMDHLGEGRFGTPEGSEAGVVLAAADLDADGVDEVIYADGRLGLLLVEFGIGGRAEIAALPNGAGSVLLGDINGDGLHDVVACDGLGGAALIYLGLGGGRFEQELNGGNGVAVGEGAVSVLAVPGIGPLADLIVVSRGSDEVSVLRGHGVGRSVAWAVAQVLRVGARPASAAVGDFTGDGVLDLAVAVSGEDSIWVLSGLGLGLFDDDAPRVLKTGPTPTRVLAGDFDGDSRTDLVSLDTGGALTYYSDVADPESSGRSVLAGGPAPAAAVARDVNGDGIMDIVVSTSDGHVSLLQGGAGGPALMRSLAAPGVAASTLAASGSSRGAFWILDGDEGHALLLQFGPAPALPAETPGKDQPGVFDLVPLKGGPCQSHFASFCRERYMMAWSRTRGRRSRASVAGCSPGSGWRGWDA